MDGKGSASETSNYLRNYEIICILDEKILWGSYEGSIKECSHWIWYSMARRWIVEPQNVFKKKSKYTAAGYGMWHLPVLPDPQHWVLKSICCSASSGVFRPAGQSSKLAGSPKSQVCEVMFPTSETSETVYHHQSKSVKTLCPATHIMNGKPSAMWHVLRPPCEMWMKLQHRSSSAWAVCKLMGAVRETMGRNFIQWYLIILT